MLDKGGGTGGLGGFRAPQFLTFTRRRFARTIGRFAASHVSPSNRISVLPLLMLDIGVIGGGLWLVKPCVACEGHTSVCFAAVIGIVCVCMPNQLVGVEN